MRRGLTQRTVLASIVVAVVVLGEFAVLFLAFQNLRAEERQDNQAVNVLATSSDLEESLLNLSTGLRIYLSSGQPAGMRPYQAALHAYPQQARQLDRLTAGNPELHRRVAALGNSITAYVGIWTSAIIQMSQVDLPGARRLANTDAAKQPVVLIRDQFEKLDDQQQALSVLRRNQAARSAALALWFGVARPGRRRTPARGVGDRPAPDRGSPGQAAGRRRGAAARRRPVRPGARARRR